MRVINTGSVSNPVALDLRASYALIDASEAGYRVEHRRVAYDVEVEIEAVERSRHPSGSLIISHFRGDRRPWWANGKNGRAGLRAVPSDVDPAADPVLWSGHA